MDEHAAAAIAGWHWPDQYGFCDMTATS